MKYVFKALLAIFIGLSSITAQELEKTWQFTSIENASSESLFNITERDTIQFKEGEFFFSLESNNNLQASGDYMKQNRLLVLYYNQPNDTIRRYKISELTDSTLVFNEAGITYKFSPYKRVIASENTIIPSQGFSLDSLWRGVLGMVPLIFIAYSI